jgi:hypothetical protein
LGVIFINNGESVFKVGVVHSLILTIVLLALTLLLTFSGVQEQYIDLSIYLIFIISVMFIGFNFKRKTGIAPFNSLINKDYRYLLYYPLGLAVFPALSNVIVAYAEHNDFALIATYPLSLFSYSVTIGSQLIIGSIFCKKITV